MTFGEKYNKSYKLLLVIPLVLLAASLFYLYTFNQQNGDFAKKDVTLAGGTTITIFPPGGVDVVDLEEFLTDRLEDFSIREISGLTTGGQEAVVVESPASLEELKTALEEYLGYTLNQDNSTIEFTGSSLSDAFYSQLIKAVIFAFILMAIVVLIIFRTIVPSLAVILSAFADIIMTLAVIDLLGIRLASAGIVAFLMLIGYSVDTDIMLTSRLLKHRDGEINERLFSAFKTGITMTLTSILAVVVALIFTASFSEVLRQIFLILAIGLVIDIFNTWIMNASILKWYLERKG